MTGDRKYDIDFLRVLAIGLLLVYHIGIGFQPWGVFIGFIQSNDSLESIWPVMALMNVWRIPLLFFVSGMGIAFAMRRRNWKELLLERSRRILLPFVFGMLALVPLHQLIWQDFYSQDLAWKPAPVHLWFLGNIFIYVLVLSPLFYYLKNRQEGKFMLVVRCLFAHPLGLLPVTACLVLEAILLQPEPYALYALNLHGFLVGLLAFFFGFLFILSGDVFWQTVSRWRWLYLGLALVLYLIRLLVFDLSAPVFLVAIESSMWIFTLFGLAHRYLKRGSRALSYLSKAAYPVYILHMIFLYLASSLLFPSGLPAWLVFLLVVGLTFSGCFASYEVIRRVAVLRILFGMKA